MSFSLYQATIPTTLQMLGAVRGLVDKAGAWCAETGTAPAELLARRIAPDMQPLAYQIKSVAVHSLGAIEGVMRGEFSPDDTPLSDTFAPLSDRLGAAVDALTAIDPKTIEGLIGRDMAFVAGERHVPFEAQDFLLSFAQPNFFFHCSMTYAILRAAGLPIGKRDFLGRPRAKAR